MLQCFVLYCREFLEQHGEFCPVCIYMRDEVRQQSPLNCLLPLKYKENLALLSNLESVSFELS